MMLYFVQIELKIYFNFAVVFSYLKPTFFFSALKYFYGPLKISKSLGNIYHAKGTRVPCPKKASIPHFPELVQRPGPCQPAKTYTVELFNGQLCHGQQTPINS